MPPAFRTPAYLREQQRQGILFSQVKVTPGPDGLQPFFLIANLGRPGVPQLTPQMIEVVKRVRANLRLRYQQRLAFMFEPFYDKQYFVLFVEGHPEIPALNFCHPNKECRRECPVYVNPVTHHVTIATMNRCADAAPIWLKPS